MSETSLDGATCVCLLTAPGRSAVAVLGVEGPRAVEAVDRHFQSANARPLDEQRLNRVIYGHWRDEDLVVCRTGEDALEIHCHGGSRSPTRIVRDLIVAGCRQVDRDTWAAEHAVNSIQAEAQLALAAATTRRVARHLLRQCQGALQREVEAIQAALERSDCELAAAMVSELLARKEFGLHLARPRRIVIAGRPNVGKSSLINAIAGYQRAIVFDQPGTTRDIVSVATALDGWPIELSDTAGIHQTSDSLETEGILRAQQEISQSDLVIWLLDATSLDEQQWSATRAVAREQAENTGISLDEIRHLIVVNKIDLDDRQVLQGGEFLAISATYELGMSELLAAITAELVPIVPAEDVAVLFTPRQIDLLEVLHRRCEQQNAVAALDACSRLLSHSTD